MNTQDDGGGGGEVVVVVVVVFLQSSTTNSAHMHCRSGCKLIGSHDVLLPISNNSGSGRSICLGALEGQKHLVGKSWCFSVVVMEN